MQPVPVLQSAPQPSVTMVRVVTHPLTSIPLNGYSAASLGGAEGNGDFRGAQTRRCHPESLTIFFSLVLCWFHSFISVSLLPLPPPSGAEAQQNRERVIQTVDSAVQGEGRHLAPGLHQLPVRPVTQNGRHTSAVVATETSLASGKSAVAPLSEINLLMWIFILGFFDI